MNKFMFKNLDEALAAATENAPSYPQSDAGVYSAAMAYCHAQCALQEMVNKATAKEIDRLKQTLVELETVLPALEGTPSAMHPGAGSDFFITFPYRAEWKQANTEILNYSGWKISYEFQSNSKSYTTWKHPEHKCSLAIGYDPTHPDADMQAVEFDTETRKEPVYKYEPKHGHA